MTLLDQAPPSDLEAEETLIGSTWSGLTIGDPESRATLWAVTPEAFLVRDHKSIWAGMQALATANKPFSEISLVWEVDPEAPASKRQDILEILGRGADVSPQPLADRVLELYARRVAIKASMALVRSAFDLATPIDEVQAQANSAFMAVAKGSNKAPDYFRSSEVLPVVQEGAGFLPAGASSKLIYFGMPFLDNLIVGSAGNVIMLGGRPGGGKTGLALQARNMTALHGIPAGFISLELSKPELQARDAAWWLSDPSMQRVFSYKQMLAGGYNAGAALQTMAHRIPAMDQAYSWCHPSGIAIGALTATISEWVQLYGIRMIVIDYFQYIGVVKQQGENMANAYAANSRAIKRCAQELGICILLLSQLNRPENQFNRPTMADFKETSQLEQDAQAALMLYRDKDGQLLMTIPKHRDGPTLDEKILTPTWPCLRFDAPEQTTGGGGFGADQPLDY